MTTPFPYSKSDAIEFIEKHQNGTKDNCYFAICLKDTGAVIGGTVVRFVDGKDSGGIWINQKNHGFGYGREAMRARAKYLFEILGLDKIHSGYFYYNEQSKKMHSKIGYEIVGEKTNICPALKMEVKEILVEITKEKFYKTLNNGK